MVEAPSMLLSEGYCPIGHGPLHRYEDSGWCGPCGLHFAIRDGNCAQVGRFVLMHLEGRQCGWAMDIDQFDSNVSLDQDLLHIYTEMKRVDDHTQWRMQKHDDEWENRGYEIAAIIT
jgi:hypothetical protein